MALIKSKGDEATFNKIYEEFYADVEDTSFDKIEYAIGKHKYTHKELSDLRMEILEVFNSDKNFDLNERYLSKILDNMLY